MAELIPLFPLSHVLLPGMPLPLHIFEQRYRDLVADVTAAGAGAPGGASFGVVALRTGTETAAGPVHDGTPDVVEVGTLAEILEVEGHQDGTSDLLSVGSRRFRITALVPDGRSYLRGRVEFLEEADGELSDDLELRARELLGVYDEMLRRLAGRATGEDLPSDANQVSYQIAARLPLPPAERQALLTDLTTAERLRRIARLLRREIALLQGTRSIAVSPAVLRLVTGPN